MLWKISELYSNDEKCVAKAHVRDITSFTSLSFVVFCFFFLNFAVSMLCLNYMVVMMKIALFSVRVVLCLGGFFSPEWDTKLHRIRN